MRSLALPPAQKNFAPLRLFWWRSPQPFHLCIVLYNNVHIKKFLLLAVGAGVICRSCSFLLRCHHCPPAVVNTMTRDAFRSPLTGAPRRAPKQWRSKNSRWMHLGAQEVMTRQILQQLWAHHSVLATNSYFLAGYTLALRQSFVRPIPIAMQQMTDLCLLELGFMPKK
jgi:hypothetical protein